jgi:predicted Zn-dependent peptidase
LSRAKIKFRVALAMGHDQMSVIRQRSNAISYNIKEEITDVEEFMERVEAVTKDDLMEAARRVFSGEPTFASIGPPKLTPQQEIAKRMELELS